MFDTINGELADAYQTPNGGSGHAAGLARLVPSVRFGLRAAVLAGVIATAGGPTTNLGSPLNTIAGPTDTTCCYRAPVSITQQI